MSRRKKKASYTGYFSTQFLTSLVSTTFVLMLLGTIVLFVISAKKASKYLKENVVVNLYLNEGVDDSQLLRLQNELDESGFVKEQLYKSKPGQEKKQMVLDFLREQGFDLEDATVEKQVSYLIEEIVKQLNIEQGAHLDK